MKIHEMDQKLAAMAERRLRQATPEIEGSTPDSVIVNINEGGGRHRINIYDPATGTLKQSYFKFCDDHLGGVGGE